MEIAARKRASSAESWLPGSDAMNSIKSLKHALIHSFAHPVGSRFPKRAAARKTVLLAAHNTLTASYLQEIWELLRDDHRIDFRLVLKRPEDSPGDWNGVRDHLPVPTVPLWWANLRRWDLVVMASHAGPFLHLATPWRHPVLRISHGIGGKVIDGEDYFYGSRTRDEQGRLMYSCLFESSYARRDHALSADGGLAGHIAVVGSRRIDKMAEAITMAAQLRQSQPDPSRRPTVLIASSWGKGNLFSKFGEPLLAAAASLRHKFDFVLRPHPLLLRRDTSGGRDWAALFQSEAAKSFRYSPPKKLLVEAISSADVVLVDDLSSVGLLAACAGARVIVARSDSTSVGNDTFLVRLRGLVPNLDSIEALESRIQSALTSWPPHGLQALVQEMNGAPGRSAELMRGEIYRLMSLEGSPPS
jgi:hypothetical protein